MTISLSNSTVNEATLGVQIGTLSGGSGYSIYFSGHTNYYVLNNNVLSLNSSVFLDSESSSFIDSTLNHTNGRITSSSYSQLGTTTVTIGYGSNLWKQFTLTIADKNEAITVTPTKFQQNKYGATIAQVGPTDSYFSGKDVYFSGPSFLEISGTNLKFTDDYYYSETGWVFTSGGSTGWNLAAGDYSWDLNFTLLEGYTTASTDADGDGNADNGYTKLATSSYLSSIFASSNITTTAAISLSATPFVERDYGAIVATINYTGSESVSYSLKNHTFFEITASNKIKLKDDYFYNKADARIEAQDGSFYALSSQGTTHNQLQITATNSANSAKLYTELITIAEISSTVFASSNVDATDQITISPVSFNDKQYGAIIASINYSGSETPAYTLTSHSFLELTSSNKIKLKDAFYFDLNTGRVVKEDLSGYTLADQGNSNKIQIHAQDAGNSKKLSSEVLTIGDITSSVFGNSNVTNRDGGTGNDIINGGTGNDILDGGKGNDTIDGGAGDDLITGGDGDDTFKVGAGIDVINDLGGIGAANEKDILIVSNSATVNAINIIKFVATSASKNEGTANLTAKSTGGTGGHIDMTLSTAGAYTITGSSTTDTLVGGIGNDTIVISSAGDGNSDTLDGGTGSDTLKLAAGSNVFSDNNKLKNIETILANASGSVVTLTGQSENFTITGGAGIDTITGGSGADTITGGAVNDIITGGAGNDIITIDSGTDKVKDLGGASGTEDDVVVVNAGATLNAVDILGFTATNATKNNSTDANNAVLTAKDGQNVTIDVSLATGSSKAFKILGGTGQDILTGGDGADIISGGDAVDTIVGNGGVDTITGGAGNDIITGGTGNDIINGGDGNDIISSGTGSDLLKGNDGNDKIYLEADGVWAKSTGQDGKTVVPQAWNVNSAKTIFEKVSIVGKNKFEKVIEGNNGTDTLELTTGSDAFFLHDTLSAFNSTLTLSDDAFGQKNIDRLVSLETINGGNGDDLIDLTSPDTQLSDAMIVNGAAGNDVIWSSAGTDTLNGGDGDDVLFGGKGIDNLTGGNGADTFEFCNQSGNDIIKDYNKSDGDKLAFYIQSGDNQSLSFSGDKIT